MKQQNRIAMFNILSTVLLNGISIVTSMLFSRMLGDSNYGTLKIYNIWASVVAILFTLQTYNTLVNARVEYAQEEQARYQSSVMWLALCLFLVCSALVLLFLKPISAMLKLRPMLIGFLLLQAFGTFCVNFLNTKYVYEFKAGRNMVLSLGVTLTTLVLSVLLILQMPQQIKYYGRVAAIALTYAGVGIPACVLILWKGRTFYNRTYWKFCIALAIPAVFHNLSDLILGQSDQVMIQHMLGDAQVGWYAYAWTLGNFLFVLFGALNRTWCPFFFEEMKQGKHDAMLQKSRNFLEVFTVLASGFILLCPEVYHVYASREFWGSTMAIPLFATSYYLNFLCTFPVNFEYYHKKTKVVALVTIFSSLVNIALNYVLIQAIGLHGAALATVCSHGLQFALHYGYTRCILGGKAYPFGVKMWVKYAIGYGLVLALVYLAADFWLLRWGVGAALGLLELRQIRKRKVLI